MAGERTPSFYYRQFSVTVAAGTAVATPLQTDVSVGDLVLDEVAVRVPAGPQGVVGFRVVLAGTQLVPWGLGPDWITGNDEDLRFDVGIQVGRGLLFLAYNTGLFAHTLALRLKVHDIQRFTVGPAPALVPASAIDAAAAASP